MGEIANNHFTKSVTANLIGLKLTYRREAAKYGAALTSPKIQVSPGLDLVLRPKATGQSRLAALDPV